MDPFNNKPILAGECAIGSSRPMPQRARRSESEAELGLLVRVVG